MDPHRSDNGMPGYVHQETMEQPSNYYPASVPPVSYGHPAPSTYIGMPMASHAPPQSPHQAHHDGQHMGISTFDSGHLQAMHHMGPGSDPSLFDVPDHHMPMMSGSYVGGVMAPSMPSSNMGMPPMIHSPMEANPYSMQDMGGHLAPSDDSYALSPGFQPDFSGQNTNNVLTEFTKRRNWPQRVLEEVPDFIHVLSSDGKILYAAPSCKNMVGYQVEELMGKTLVDFIHEDDAALFLLEFNECMKRNTDFRMFFRLRTKSQAYSVFDVEGHPHFTGVPRSFHGGPRLPDSSTQMGDCAGFFMNARPYPSRNMVLLDSFLEHRIENVRLNQRVNDLKLEEEEDTHGYQMSPTSYGDSTPRGYAGNITPISTSTLPSTGGGLRSPTGSMGQGLTKQNLDVAGAESIDDRMARFGNNANAEAIEMFTGLRYNERSKGISTGATSPALIRGDAGVPLPTESHSRHMGDKKKKVKVTEDYVCTDCATLESPEWRKGPKGPKTLCNACGLRWAKREKKKQADMAAQQGSASAK